MIIICLFWYQNTIIAKSKFHLLGVESRKPHLDTTRRTEDMIFFRKQLSTGARRAFIEGGATLAGKWRPWRSSASAHLPARVALTSTNAATHAGQRASCAVDSCFQKKFVSFVLHVVSANGFRFWTPRRSYYNMLPIITYHKHVIFWEGEGEKNVLLLRLQGLKPSFWHFLTVKRFKLSKKYVWRKL